jgi:hypothetical protein
VPYRALKLQLQVDDDAIEALKDELIYTQHMALDEVGRVLVWAGDMGATPTPDPTPSPSGPSDSHTGMPADVTLRPGYSHRYNLALSALLMKHGWAEEMCLPAVSGTTDGPTA